MPGLPSRWTLFMREIAELYYDPVLVLFIVWVFILPPVAAGIIVREMWL